MEIHFNYEKCAVMIFDNNARSRHIQLGNCTRVCHCGYHWKLGDKLIQQVNSYKYLGIELDPVLSYKEFKQRIREKARKNMSKIWGMGMINGALSVKASITLYDALVRSILEYGAEIWGSDGWEEGEKIQREMGRKFQMSWENHKSGRLRRIGMVEIKNQKRIHQVKILVKNPTHERHQLSEKNISME